VTPQSLACIPLYREYPVLSQVTTLDEEAEFDFGLEAIIAGVASRLGSSLQRSSSVHLR
jgi:hypothetical protein